MTHATRAAAPPRSQPAGGLHEWAPTSAADLNSRLHDRRFWLVQALVLLVTGLHYGIEALGDPSPASVFHDVTMTLYVIPLLYAALTFSWEGALMTVLWIVCLTVPSTLIWHRSEADRLVEVVQLVITLFVGMLVAWRVHRETQERRRAERMSANLKLLHAIGEDLSHTLDVERRLPNVIHQLRSGLMLGSAVLRLEPEHSGGAPLLFRDGWKLERPSSRDQGVRASEAGAAVADEPRLMTLPLVTQDGVRGSLSVAAVAGGELSDEQVEVVTAASRAVSVAVENAHLYRQRQENLQAYMHQVTQAQENERLRIARELHDDTAQELVHLVRKLEQCGPDAGSASSSIEEVLTIARGILKSIRRFSRDLRPSVLDDLGLLPALNMIVAEANSHLAGGAQLNICGTPRRLEPPVELALFRIAQEALRNVEKHAHATTATVDLHFDCGCTRLTISDDGTGFSPPKNLADLVRTGKLGVIGMKERAESAGGSFDLLRLRDGGVRLTVWVPDRQ